MRTGEREKLPRHRMRNIVESYKRDGMLDGEAIRAAACLLKKFDARRASLANNDGVWTTAMDVQKVGVTMIDAVPGEEIVDIQFAVDVVKEKLPGWVWKICSCCVSDDAWVAPDFNDPVHGARLHAELDPVAFDSHFDSGFDVDRRPPGNAGQALLDAMDLALSALTYRREAALVGVIEELQKFGIE